MAVFAVIEWRYQKAWKRIVDAGNPADVGFTRGLFLLCLLFERERAHWRMSLCEAELPRALRAPVLRVIALLLDADLSELRKPLESYRTIGDFFARELKDGARRIDASSGAVLALWMRSSWRSGL